MIIIISHHFVVHGIILSEAPVSITYNLNSTISYLIGCGGYLGNSIFMIISGYFMIYRECNWKRIIVLVFSMICYSWLIAILFYGSGYVEYTVKNVLSAMFPFLRGYNWFVCCYIIFFLFLPIINPILENFSKNQYLLFVCLLWIFYGIFPYFYIETFMNAPIIQFLFMYSIGGYIRRYGNSKWIQQKKIWWAIFLFNVLFLLCSIMLIGIIGMSGKEYHFVPFFSNFIAVSLFMIFVLKTPWKNLWINRIAKSVLGVYLIHDNPIVRHWLWRKFYPNLAYLDESYFILFMIGKIIVVFMVCTGIDIVRQYFIEKPFVTYLDKFWPVLCKKKIKMMSIFSYYFNNFSKKILKE